MAQSQGQVADRTNVSKDAAMPCVDIESSVGRKLIPRQVRAYASVSPGFLAFFMLISELSHELYRQSCSQIHAKVWAHCHQIRKDSKIKSNMPPPISPRFAIVMRKPWLTPQSPPEFMPFMSYDYSRELSRKLHG